MPTLKFAVLAGDYIGPEVMTEALRVLDHVGRLESLTLQPLADLSHLRYVSVVLWGPSS